MGVLRLFRYYLNKYSQSKFYISLRKVWKVNQRPEILLLDLNAIFHPCFREIFSSDTESMLRKFVAPTLEEGKKKAFETVCKKVMEIVNIMCPTKCIYLAIDGVAGCCKQSQQRKRRFMSSKTRKEGEFDYSILTCGTELMQELSTYIEEFVKEKSMKEWSYLKIIFNGVNVPGEGEHKLIRYLQDNLNMYNSSCIYSPDADLIMLGMTLQIKRLTILRENIYKDIRGDYILVILDKLKQLIIDDIRWESISIKFEEHRAIKDYVLFLFMIGNDFLPHMKGLDIYTKEIDESGISKLILYYLDSIINNIDHTEDISQGGYLLDENNNIRKESIEMLFDEISRYEVKNILDNFNKTKSIHIDKLVNSNIKIIEDKIQGSGSIEVLDFDKFRREYYEQKLGIVYTIEEEFQKKINIICEEYIKGLSFVIKYYTRNIPTYDWYYPYHYCPLAIDIKNYLKNIKEINQVFIYKPPLNQLENLVSVLPPSSWWMLPSEVNNDLRKRVVIDQDFQEEFDIDMDGKIQDYEGIPILNMIHYNKVKLLCKKHIHLTPELNKYNGVIEFRKGYIKYIQ